MTTSDFLRVSPLELTPLNLSCDFYLLVPYDIPWLVLTLLERVVLCWDKVFLWLVPAF
jgi:hypothetical protein